MYCRRFPRALQATRASAPQFHGIVMSAGRGQRFVVADQVASLHERGVDLRIDAAAAAALPEPHGGAAAWRDRDPQRQAKPLDAHPGHDERRGFAPAGLDPGGLEPGRAAAGLLRRTGGWACCAGRHSSPNCSFQTVGRFLVLALFAAQVPGFALPVGPRRRARADAASSSSTTAARRRSPLRA